MTVQPLANDLGLTVDTSCDRDDANCVTNLVDNYGSQGTGQNVLICWEHDNLTGIVEGLGDGNAPDYPDDVLVFCLGKEWMVLTRTDLILFGRILSLIIVSRL
jgi:hypothetical protein